VDERAHGDADGSQPTPPSSDESDEEATDLQELSDRGRRLQRIGMGVGRTFAILLAIAVLGTTGYGWWTFGDVDDATVTTDVIGPDVANTRVPLDGAVDMLLVGVDSRTDAYGNPLPREVLDMLHAGRYEGERNTDTMILVHIPVDGTRAVAFSFPRDSLVEIAGGFGKHKLNSAFARAYNDARRELVGTSSDEEVEAQAAAIGRKNLIATIEQLIGKAVTIDRYAEVTLASFYEITKAIGGVEVCLNAPVDEWRSGANFPAGPQIIEGADALAFVRQRYDLPNGDLDRIVRQQAFLGALADKVLSADMLTSPAKVRELITAVQKSVVLSKGWELSRFAAQMSGLTSGAIDFYTIPTQGGATIGGADVIRVDPAEVHQFVAALTSGESTRGAREPVEPRLDPPSASVSPTTPPTAPQTARTSLPTRTSEIDTDVPDARPPGAITVSVRNASETVGLAALVLDRLAQQGFRRGDTGDAPVQAVSVVRYGSGEQLNARLVANSLGWELPLEPDLSLPAGQVRVVLGTDYPTGLNQGITRGPAVELAPTTPPGPGTPTTSGEPSPGDGTALPAPLVAGQRACVN
jgi:LCP family protein required for cell wall assembly